MFNKIKNFLFPAYRYHYFVSYNFNTGDSFGNGMIEMNVNAPITTYKQVCGMKDWILESDPDISGVIINNYIFLEKIRVYK